MTQGRSRIAAIALGLASAALLAHVAATSAALVGRTFPGFLVWSNGIVAAFHAPGWTGIAAELPAGARVVAIEGEPFVSGRALLVRTAALEPGTEVGYTLRAGEGLRELRVATMTFAASDWAATFGVYLLCGGVLFLVAAVALWLRPDRHAARAVALCAALLGCVTALSIDFLCTYRFVHVYPVVEALAPAAIAWFALAFPVERVRRERRRAVAAGLFAPSAALGLAQVALAPAQPDLAFRLNSVVYALLGVVPLVAVASFVAALWRAPTPGQRMSVAVVLTGGIAAGLPAAVLTLASVLLGWQLSFTWIVGAVSPLPLAVLYGVVRGDLLGAERFVRLGVGYSVATSCVVLGYSVALFGAERWVLAGISQQPIALLALLIALALGIDPLRRRVQTAIDRAFFRSAPAPERILEAASGALALHTERRAIADYVEALLGDSLALEWASLGPGDGRAAALEVPVDFQDNRLAVLRCGPKRSGAPFSEGERQLVRGIASQAALALHHADTILRLRDAQHLAAVGEISGAVAHGLRNPLAGIRAATQLALERASGTPAAAALEGVLEEVDRIDARVTDLLEFSRPFDVKLERVDCAALLQALAGELAPRAASGGVEVAVDARDVALRADPRLLGEALRELAANALAAMPGGGQLQLSASPARGGVAHLRVGDSGHGIPPGVQDRVFELFFTTRPGGTGVGLATARRMVERMGGSLVLERSSRDGTCFRIELPAADLYGTGTTAPTRDATSAASSSSMLPSRFASRRGS